MTLSRNSDKGELTGSNTVDSLYEAGAGSIEEVVTLVLRNKADEATAFSIYLNGSSADDIIYAGVLDAMPEDSPTGGMAIIEHKLAASDELLASTPTADAVLWFVSAGVIE